MELSGTTKKFQVLSNYFHPLSVSGKIDWHASDSTTRFKPALFGLMCAWREVMILCQHTFLARPVGQSN
jgi:hypothetical protein